MKTHESTRLLCISASVVALLVSGCATTYKVRTGSVHGGDLKPGYPCPDFTFIDQDGRADTFSHVRGAVTLVVFPDDPRWPSCDKCKDLVDLAARLGRPRTSVVVVGARSPEDQEQCPAATLHRYHIDWPAQLVALWTTAGACGTSSEAMRWASSSSSTATDASSAAARWPTGRPWRSVHGRPPNRMKMRYGQCTGRMSGRSAGDRL